MGSKYTKRYTEEFKQDAIALVDSSSKTVTAFAGELGISSESLRGWYRKAKAEQGRGHSRRIEQCRARGAQAAAAGEPRSAANDRDPEKGDRLLREGERPVSELWGSSMRRRRTTTISGRSTATKILYEPGSLGGMTPSAPIRPTARTYRRRISG
ncbi:transposase [Streptomyces sp. NBC_00490]|uniref:transposase n=1 Tax=Streptomyces sp. NBC_00490 TaxID=2903657 RepID=UPI003FCD7985